MKHSMTTQEPVDIGSTAELFKPRESTRSLEKVFSPGIAKRKQKKASALAPHLRSAFTGPAKRKRNLARIDHATPQTVTLDEVDGTLAKLFDKLDFQQIGTITLTLPFGMDNCCINAATFKALAGREGSTLLRLSGKRWEILEDDAPIDLGDKTQRYKLGGLQIFS